MTREFFRTLVFRWVMGLAVIHLLVGLLLTFGTGSSFFSVYHQQIILGFGFDATDAKALALHQWWLNLFGATLQNLGFLMLLLIFVANKFRYANLWLWMVIGLLVWAPQDMWISLRIHLITHIWIDVVVLLLLVPPLLYLWWIDNKNNSSP